MGYSFLVLVKQVPDTTAVSSTAMKADGTLNRSALPAVFNPEDLHALEMALQLKERYGGSVAAASMGPPAAAAVLRDALYRGADRVVLVTDRKFAGSDTLATSAVLSCVVRKIGHFDVILCGRQAIDGNTAQVGPQVAEKLGINQLTYAREVQALGDGKIRVLRDVEDGKELVQADLPVLVTVADTANTPRPPSVLRMMRFKNAAAPSERLSAGAPGRRLLLEEWNAADLGIDVGMCGLAGSPTRVKKIENVVLKSAAFKKIAPTDEGIKALLEELIADYTFD